MKSKRFLSWILSFMTVLPLILGMTTLSVSAEPTNVALGKPVTAAGSWANNITDGNINSYWDGGAYPQSATIDLGGYYRLTSLKMINYFDGYRYYHYDIYISDNGKTYSRVASKSDSKVASAKGESYSLDAVARYIRLTVTYNSANEVAHINEFEAYGVPEEGYIPVSDPNAKDPSDPDNIAFGKPTRAGDNDVDSYLVTDGDPLTTWSASDMPYHVDVDLGKLYDVSEVSVFLPVSSAECSYNVYLSEDGAHYDRVASVYKKAPTSEGFTHDLTQWSSDRMEEGPVTARFVRVLVTNIGTGSGGTSRVSEIRVHGTESQKENKPVRTALTFTSYTDWLNSTYGKNLTAGEYAIEDTYTAEDTLEALNGLVKRILGEEYISAFEFVITGKAGNDGYTLSDNGKKIRIEANTGVAAAAGLNYYLKYYCQIHISQQTSQVNMPKVLPKVGEPVSISSPYEVRYAYNYCTLSYTMPFYGYDDWQRELDYLMLSGVNVILDTTATEALWVYYLQNYGYTANDALSFVSGYAYKAWWLMGNLQGYGGPVSDEWVIDTLELARVNQRYMTVMGVMPCLEGFMGMLPLDFSKKAAKALESKGCSSIESSLVPQGGWASFARPTLCKTNYNGYATLAADFYAAQEYLYGPVTDYYAGDLAHEGGVLPKDQSKAQMSADILGHMMAADPDAVWIIQSWQGNPDPEVLKGFGQYREDHVLILDLNATSSPGWQDTATWGGKEFGGTGWVYCMLDNYGGRPGMHGDLNTMKTAILRAYGSCGHMKGIGLTSEGTQMNPICQELLWEMAWRTENFDLSAWIDLYVTRRYGIESAYAKEAWQILWKAVYNYSGYHNFNVNSLVNMTPGFSPSAISGSYEIDYDPVELEKAAALLMQDYDLLKKNACYVYDLVDLFKQILSNTQVTYFETAVKAYNVEDYAVFTKYKNKFLSSVRLMNEVCRHETDSTIEGWLGRIDGWIRDGRTGQYDDFSEDMMRMNAKILITGWCSGSLHNYAYRQYSGMLTETNYVMWEAFFESLDKGMVSGSANLPSDAFYFNTQWNWAIENKSRIPVLGFVMPVPLDELYEEIRSEHSYSQTKGVKLTDTNIAGSGKAYAKTEQGGYPASNVADGNLGSLWIPTSPAVPTYVGVKFDSAVEVTGVKIIGESRNPLGIDDNAFYVEALIDGSYVKVGEGSMYNDEAECYSNVFLFDEPIITTDIRVTITEKNGLAWPAIAELKIYTDPKNISTEVVTKKLTVAPSMFGSFENWVNSPNNPGGAGCQPGVTQLLTSIKDEKGGAISISKMLDWVLTFDDGKNVQTVHLKPATVENAYNLYRFEPCMATGQNQFIPVKGKTYTVTVQVYDGEDLLYEGVGKGFTCNIEPVASYTDTVPVTGVKLNKTECTLKVGETAELKATVLPADADNSELRWYISDDSVLSFVNGKLTALSEGMATVTVKTVDGGYTASCTVTVISATDYDLSGDGVISIRDVTVLLNYLSDPIKYPVPEGKNPDLTGDGTADISDVTKLLTYLSEMI